MKRTMLSLAAITALLVLIPACDGGREGDRCNPNLSHADCNDGLSCITPFTCVETYCCLSDPTKSTRQYCNGSGCPQPTPPVTPSDAGSD